MSFRVGQKVVCIDDKPNGLHKSWGDSPIYKGQIYVIRDIEIGFRHPFAGVEDCVRLEGIDRTYYGVDWPYRKSRFRPLVETKTSIEVFNRMLTPKEEIAAFKRLFPKELENV